MNYPKPISPAQRPMAQGRLRSQELRTRLTKIESVIQSDLPRTKVRAPVERNGVRWSRSSRAGHVTCRRSAPVSERACCGTGRTTSNLDSHDYCSYSMRRTKATLIHRKTKNLREVQLLLGRSDMASSVRFLGIAVDGDLEISEQFEV